MLRGCYMQLLYQGRSMRDLDLWVFEFAQLELLLAFLPISSHFISSSYPVHHAYKSIPLFSNVSPFSFLAIFHKLCVRRVPICYIYTSHTHTRSCLPYSHVSHHQHLFNTHQIHNWLPRHPNRPHPRPPFMVPSRQIPPATDFAPRGPPLHRAPANALAG